MTSPQAVPGDFSGFSQIGRYGTLSLLKNQEPYTLITAFGIDTEELTFGRDPDCGVRLYYPDVSLIHCKLVFEERKAFLSVFGPSGVVIDGCKVLPNTPGSVPTTVPLTNNSEIEVHNKRFRFTYPPKELRAALIASPRKQNRALRLSMIHSAQVFSPRPSQDPRENLRILQSPLKNSFKPQSPRSSYAPSPIRQPFNPYQGGEDSDPEEEEDGEDDEIVLVEGNHPRVVQEDKDLVILEDVEVSPPPSPQEYLPPRTPQRPRSQSLHRAVLMRSVQRAVMKLEKEKEEEEEEEMEVLDTVVDEESSDGNEGVGEGEHDDGSESEEDQDLDEVEGDEERKAAQKSVWRKSLERIWPFKSSSPAPVPPDASDSAHSGSDGEEEPQVQNGDVAAPADQEPGEAEEQEEDTVPEVVEVPRPPQSQSRARNLLILQTPARRKVVSSANPAPFFTPRPNPSIFPGAAKGPPGRMSLGPGVTANPAQAHSEESGDFMLPRRLKLEEQPWKVKDIIVPAGQGQSEHQNEVKRESLSPVRVIPGTPRGRQALTDEERKAIQERRRSAAKDAYNPLASPVRFSATTGFTPSTPSLHHQRGMSPSNPFAPPSPSGPLQSNRSRSISPAKQTAVGSLASPSKAWGPDDGIKEEEEPVSPIHAQPSTPHRRSRNERPSSGDDEGDLDTRGLLERMKETVEGMKRRRSLALGLTGSIPPTPIKDGERRQSVFQQLEVDLEQAREEEQNQALDVVMQAPIVPSEPEPVPGVSNVGDASAEDVLSDDVGPQHQDLMPADLGVQKDPSPEPFSLLRPEAREEARRISGSFRSSLSSTGSALGSSHPGTTSAGGESTDATSYTDVIPTVVVQPSLSIASSSTSHTSVVIPLPSESDLEGEMDVDPRPTPARRSRRTAQSAKKTITRVSKKKTPEQEDEVELDEAESPVEEVQEVKETTKGKGKATLEVPGTTKGTRGLRVKSKTPEPSESGSGSGAKPRSTSRTREDGADEVTKVKRDSAAAPPAKRGATKAALAKSAAMKAKAETDDSGEDVKPVRRGRKPVSATAKKEEDEAPALTLKRSTRKAATTTAAVAPPAPKKRVVKGKAKAEEAGDIEPDEDEDPLDSIDSSKEGDSIQPDESMEDPPPAKAPARARSKPPSSSSSSKTAKVTTTTTKPRTTRAARTKVKQEEETPASPVEAKGDDGPATIPEEDESEAVVTPAPTATRRGGKAARGGATVTRSAPARVPGGTAAQRRVPVGKEKENAGRASGSNEAGGDEEVPADAKKVVRVSRSRKAAVDDGDEGDAAPVEKAGAKTAPVTRTSRARTPAVAPVVASKDTEGKGRPTRRTRT